MRLRAVDIWGRRIVVARPKSVTQENYLTWWLSRHYSQPPLSSPQKSGGAKPSLNTLIGALGPALSSLPAPYPRTRAGGRVQVRTEPKDHEQPCRGCDPGTG